MNIRQLQYFLAVAAELNFTRASERVNIAQPALSAQIISLEEELGTALFTREKRKVLLTPAGEILVEHAQRVLNTASAAMAAVRASGRGAQAHLMVGAIYTAIYCFLPNTLRLFKELAPHSDVSLQEMTISQQINALKEGAIEVGLVRGHIYDHSIVTELLYRELLVVAVPPEASMTCPMRWNSRNSRRGRSSRWRAAQPPKEAMATGSSTCSKMRTASPPLPRKRMTCTPPRVLSPQAWAWPSCRQSCSLCSRSVSPIGRLMRRPRASRYPSHGTRTAFPPCSDPGAKPPEPMPPS